ncbi:hypothetical protein IJI00_01270 [Candidatus Saccharibacteria bacterium]|nr:hypothetical protein [Candidatus Saccharibacteria bacterium]
MAKLGGKIKERLRKRKVHIKIKSWMLLLALVPLGFIDATLLRYDHIRMTELLNVVLEADVEENDVKLAEALTELKEFVFSNVVINIVEENGVPRVMFGTGPFNLKHQYLRDARKALEEAEAKLVSDNNPNGNIYGKAGEVCRAQAISNGWAWDSPGFINCMLSEIQKYPAADNIEDTVIANLPSTELYWRNYASPLWAPTLTGWMLLLTAVVIMVLILRLIVYVVLRVSLFFV